MSAENHGKRNWLSIILKILFGIAALFLITITVMANLGGNNPNLQKSIEEFVSENTRYNASVGIFNGMTFFPNISFDFEDTEFSKKGDPAVVMALNKFQAAFSFWDVMASNGKIKVLKIENFTALPGSLLQQQLKINRLEILDTVEGPRFEMRGRVGDQDFSFSSGINVEGSGKKKKYSFGKEHPFELRWGDIKATGLLRGGRHAGLAFENLEVFTGEDKTFTGKIHIVRNDNRIDIAGNLIVAPQGSDLQFDLEKIFSQDGTSTPVTGTVESQNLRQSDFAPGSPYDRFMTILEKTFPPDPAEKNSNVMLNVKAVDQSGPYNGPLPLKAYRLDASSLATQSITP